MSVNKYQPHVFVLPEDDANRQLANGFLLDQFLFTRKVHVLEEVGGWTEVLEHFKSEHVSYETIGLKLAKDCREETDGTWRHPLLQHNAAEVDRLRKHVRPILFESVRI